MILTRSLPELSRVGSNSCVLPGFFLQTENGFDDLVKGNLHVPNLLVKSRNRREKQQKSAVFQYDLRSFEESAWLIMTLGRYWEIYYQITQHPIRSQCSLKKAETVCLGRQISFCRFISGQILKFHYLFPCKILIF